MGNDQSKWNDFTKEEKIEAAKDYVKDVKAVCDQFVARLEAGDVEDLSEPEYAISRFFSSGSERPNPEFSFKIEFGMKGIVKKTIKKEEFWPKDTIKNDDEDEDKGDEDKEDEEDKEDHEEVTADSNSV